MSDDDFELPDDIYEKVTELSQQGDALFASGQHEAAFEKWQEALRLLPEPKNQWEAALWLYGTMGDAYRSLGKIDDALSSFEDAYRSADGYTNPFILISLGACLYDKGRKEEAVDPLLRAYMLEGKELFDEYGGSYFQLLEEKKLIH